MDPPRSCSLSIGASVPWEWDAGQWMGRRLGARNAVRDAQVEAASGEGSSGTVSIGSVNQSRSGS